MRVLIIPPKGDNIHEHDTDGTLERLQNLVGGYIECGAPVELREAGMQLLVNEEGVLRNLPYNENLYPFFFVGTAVIIGFNGDSFTGLTPEQLEHAKEWLARLRLLY